jgi:hypothetical protein
MSFFRKNANLVVEVGVDDEEHDDEFKDFRSGYKALHCVIYGCFYN